MASGYVASPDGEHMYVYSSGQPFTHGGDAGADMWGNNTGVRVNVLRKDGFTSVASPYVFFILLHLAITFLFFFYGHFWV